MTAKGPRAAHEHIFGAITTLLRYAASLARLDGRLPGESPEFELRLARLFVDAMGIEQEKNLVAIAAQIDKNVERRARQARVAWVATQMVDAVRGMKDRGARGALKNQGRRAGPDNPATVNAAAKVLEDLSKFWELPIDEASLHDVAQKVVDEFFSSHGAEKNLQARVGIVIAAAAYPNERMADRTLNGAISALSGVAQTQGLFQKPGAATEALKFGPNERDIALWGLSQAFPVASHTDLVRMLDAARAVLHPRLQETPGALQQRAGTPVLPKRRDAAPPNSKRPRRAKRAR